MVDVLHWAHRIRDQNKIMLCITIIYKHADVSTLLPLLMVMLLNSIKLPVNARKKIARLPLELVIAEFAMIT